MKSAHALTASIATCIAAMVAAAGVRSVHAQPAWPAKPVRMLVGYAPGGPVDIVARLTAARLSELLGQQFARRSAIGGLAVARTRARANSALFATAHARPARAAWAWDAAVGTLVQRVADALIPYALAVARAEVGAAGRHVTRLAAPKLFAQALGRADTPAVT